jgi:hypothetical protein
VFYVPLLPKPQTRAATGVGKRIRYFPICWKVVTIIYQHLKMPFERVSENECQSTLSTALASAAPNGHPESLNVRFFPFRELTPTTGMTYETPLLCSGFFESAFRDRPFHGRQRDRDVAPRASFPNPNCFSCAVPGERVGHESVPRERVDQPDSGFQFARQRPKCIPVEAEPTGCHARPRTIEWTPSPNPASIR